MLHQEDNPGTLAQFRMNSKIWYLTTIKKTCRMAVISEVTTSELAGLKGQDEIKIIDVRPVDACNGWRMQNESRDHAT